MPAVAVIGAGISGAACARRLADAGLEPVVFEKSRGPGGRSSTRRLGDFSFDHGAQYFTVRDADFAQLVEGFRSEGLVERWTGRLVELEGGATAPLADEDRWVGVPGMSVLARRLLDGLDFRPNHRVRQLVRGDGGWYADVASDARPGPFRSVVLAVPAPQVAALTANATRLAEVAAAVAMGPCWAAMFVFAEGVPVEYDAATVIGGRIAWIARNSSKPSRPTDPHVWVVHATAEWSTAYLDLGGPEVQALLLEAFREETGVDVADPVHVDAHRWRYALAAPRPGQPGTGSVPGDPPCLYDASRSIGLCGDWLSGARIESAALSGLAMADRLIEEFGGAGTTHTRFRHGTKT